MPRDKSRVALLLHGNLVAQDGGDLVVHEGPGHIGILQRALLSARTVHLGADALPFDALPRAGEAELVVPLGRALHKVGVLEALLAEGALEQRVGDGVGDGGGGDALLGGAAAAASLARVGSYC